MRLLKLGDNGEFSLTKDFIDDTPRYAILSHTWGADDDEVIFSDLENLSGTSKAGYAKLQFCGKQAKKDGLEYFWVDTCCINKANHAELSEAIASMFRWYSEAQHCYVYLSDVSVSNDSNSRPQQAWETVFRNSRWFTRGWTLQELIAPRSVKFFSQEEKLLGDKKILEQQIEEITGIPITALSGKPLIQFSIEERLRWAAKRSTRRREDQAYCLQGIFGIFMAPIYGEGDYAFVRLEEEIKKRSGKKDTAVTMFKPRARLTSPVELAPSNNSHRMGTRQDLHHELDGIVFDPTRNPSSRDRLVSKIDLGKIPYASGAIFNSSDNFHSVCHSATRVDLLDQIQSWMRQPQGKSIFWLHGWAGTGKSTISWTVAKWLTDQRNAGDVDLGASFFFRRGEGDRGSSLRFFPTIIRQLVLKIPGLAALVAEVIESDPFIFDKALGEQFSKLIFQPLQKLNKNVVDSPILVVVVDALDECEREGDIKTILQLWSSVAEIKTACLRLFLTSRPDLPIQLGFQKMSVTIHEDMVLQDAVPQTTIQHDLFVYLKDTLSEICNEYNQYSASGTSLSSDWPGDEKLKRLVDMAVPLFIVAATVCRFVGDFNWDAEERLNEILAYQGIGQLSQMEQTYLPVVKQLAWTLSDARDEQKLYQEFRTIAGSIVCLAEPLSVKSLAELLDILPGLVIRRLNPLHSVLRVPANHETPIRTLHLSFTEFLLSDKLRNQPFGVDGPRTHLALSRHCLRLLSSSHGLQENMCGLEYPGKARREIDSAVIAKRLSPALQYACRYWVYHVEHSLVRIKDRDEVHIFLKKHFLHWLEALCLMNRLAESISLVNVLQSLVGAANSHYLSSFIEDARRIILANLYIVDLAPLQLYSSVMVFAPQQSLVRTICGQIPKWLLQHPVAPQTWSLELQKLEGNNILVEAVVFSPDGSLLASSSSDSTLKLWDPKTGLLMHELGGHRSASVVAFSSDGSLLASASNQLVLIWDVKTGRELRKLEGHTLGVSGVAFSHGGSQLASVSYDKTVRLWDTMTGQQVQLLESHPSSVTAVAFSPDGSLLASASPFTVKLWDMRMNRPKWKLLGHESGVPALAFSPNGFLLASASYDRTVRLWDTRTGQEVQKLRGTFGGFVAVAFSPDGLLLASASQRIVQLWDILTGQEVQKLEGHTNEVKSVSFSPDGLLLASGALDSTVRLWSVRVGQEVPQLEGHNERVNSVAFSPDGSLLASASNDSTVRLWDVTTGGEIRVLEGHKSGVSAVVFAPGGSLLVSATNDKTIRLWDVVTGRGIHIIEEGHLSWVNALVFSPDGSLLASASNDKIVRLWDMRNGREAQKPLRHGDAVNTVAFSPDGLILASGSGDSIVQLWNVSTGQNVQMLRGHGAGITALAFSPDSSRLASSSYDRTVQLWGRTVGGRFGRVTEKLYNVPALKRIRFAHGNSTLFTDRGAFDIGGDNSASSHDDDEIVLCDDWIQHRNRKLLWLPFEYRGCSAFCNGRLATGAESGRVSIFQLECP